MAQQHVIGKHATKVETNEGITMVIYHWTAVVEWNRAANTVVLRSGGFQTQTTKTRMNQTSNMFGLGFRVYQKNHEWYVQCPNGNTVPFADGMCFSVK